MTNFTRHCQSAPERKCDRVPQCLLDCDFDAGEQPIYMLPDPPEWQTEPQEFKWTLVAWAFLLVAGAFLLVAWAILLVAGAFGIVGLLL